MVRFFELFSSNLLVDERIKLVVEHQVNMALDCANHILEPLVAETLVSDLPVCCIVHYPLLAIRLDLVHCLIFEKAYEKRVFVGWPMEQASRALEEVFKYEQRS